MRTEDGAAVVSGVRRGRALAGLLVAMTLLVTGCTAAGEGTQGSGEGFVSGDGSITQVEPADREVAPDVAGPTVMEPEQTVALSDFRGQVVVLNVWASWCEPCRAETPDLVQASAELEGTAQFLGLNAKENNPAAEQAYLRTAGVPYPSLDDPSGELQLLFAGNLPPAAIPSTLVIDPEGRIAARVLGTVTAATLRGLVADAEETS